MRPLEGKGELIKVEGTKGTADLLVDPGQGIKSAVAKVGGEHAFVVLFELKEEARVHKAFADKLKLKELGKITPMLQANETSVVIIPEIKFGDLKLTNVPAIVDDLTPYTVTGEVPRRRARPPGHEQARRHHLRLPERQARARGRLARPRRPPAPPRPRSSSSTCTSCCSP
jgi:hypothetical protein